MGKSEITKQNILNAAEEEFSQKGISGARVDEIASKAQVNKRMIYAYFQNKENLYKTVLCEVYGRLSKLENTVLSEDKSYTEIIREIIKEYFYFLKSDPSFVHLILWENLNQGKYMDDERIFTIKQPGLETIRHILKEGIAKGEFRPDIDIEQVVLSINMFCFAYFSNKYTMSKILNLHIDNVDELEHRIIHVSDMIIRYISIK